MIAGLAMVMTLVSSVAVRAEPTYNMVNDHRFYQYSGYRAKKQYGYCLRIGMIRDERSEAERISRSVNATATDDTFWMYPVPEMIERILFREFALSFLFPKVSREDEQGDLIMELVLKSFHGHMERAGLLARIIHGSVAFSATLVQQNPRKVILNKDYQYQTKVKLKPMNRSKDHMVRQVARCLEEVVPVLITDVETALEKIEPPRKAPSRPGKTKKNEKPLNPDPIGPK
jgi:hypothetical protein